MAFAVVGIVRFASRACQGSFAGQRYLLVRGIWGEGFGVACDFLTALLVYREQGKKFYLY